jgi:hypothetical protein
VLSIYPVIHRRQALAHELALLQDMECERNLSLLDTEPQYAANVIKELKAQLVTIRGDFIRFPITYNFHALDERENLAAVVPYAGELAERGSQSNSPAVRASAEMLNGALRDLADTLATEFLRLEPSRRSSGVLPQRSFERRSSTKRE